MIKALRQFLTSQQDSGHLAWDEAVANMRHPLKRRLCPVISIAQGPEVRTNSEHRTTLFWEIYR